MPSYLIAVHLWTWVFFGSTFFSGGRADFRQLYVAGYMVRTGQSQHLYDTAYQLSLQNHLVSKEDVPLPFLRPAYEALLFVPFSLIPFKAAYFSMLGINIGLLVVVLLCMRNRLARLAAVYSWLPLALLLGYLPFAAALLQGQDSILLATLLLGVQLALERGKHFSAGALLGLAIFKFQIVLPIALMFLLWRCGRFIWGFASTTALAVGLSIWLIGISEALAYPTVIFHFGYPLPLGYMPNIRGLLFLFTREGQQPTMNWVLILVSLTFLVFAWKAGYRNSVNRLYLAIATACAVSFYLLIHDLSVLFVPIVITLDRFLALAGAEWHANSILCAAALLYVAPLMFSYSPSHFGLFVIPLSLFMIVLARTADLQAPPSRHA